MQNIFKLLTINVIHGTACLLSDHIHSDIRGGNSQFALKLLPISLLLSFSLEYLTLQNGY